MEGGAADYTINTAAVTDMMSGVGDSLKSFAEAALPILGGIAAGVMIFWLGRWMFRLIKSWTSKAGS